MLNISGGKSEKNRISFYTKSFQATAIRKENGEIYCECGKKETKNLKQKITFLCIIGIILLIKSKVLIPLIENNTIDIIWYFVPMFFYIALTIFSIICIRVTGGKELLRNHAAEHMTVSAYNKLKRIPTVREVKKFSRINRCCGISIYSALITGQIISFIIFFYADFKISEILLLLISLFFATIFPFNVLGKFGQLFTTSKPNKENIELAIAALKSLINYTSSITDRFMQEHFDEIIENKEIDIDYDSFFEEWKFFD